MLKIYIIYTTVVKLFSKIYYIFIVLILIFKYFYVYIYLGLFPHRRPNISIVNGILCIFFPFFFFLLLTATRDFRAITRRTLRDISCAHVILTHGPLLRRLYRATPTVDLLNEIGFPFERVFYPQNSREGWLMKWVAFRWFF